MSTQGQQSTITGSCLECKKKYVCQFKSPDTHSCDHFATTYKLIKIEYEPQFTFMTLFIKSKSIIGEYQHMKSLQCQASKLGLQWILNYAWEFKGFYRDPSNKFVIYEIQ